MALSRRTFCTDAASLLLSPRFLLSQATPTSRPDVAAIDHDRIMEAARHYATQPPKTFAALPCPRSPATAQDYYSEADDFWPDSSNPTAPYTQREGQINPEAFTAHRDALMDFCICVPVLTAAFVLTKDGSYAKKAVAHLRAWFLDPATRMNPEVSYGSTVLPAKTGRPEGVVEAVHLAEVAVCLPFLENDEGFTQADRAGVRKWFTDYLQWLNTSRLAGLARDSKSHHGASWLLQASAAAHLYPEDDARLTTLRHQFRSATIRAQINADGFFPRELTTRNPYRNTLFVLDMLAAVCVLLSTRFESVWEYELQDGPGMRAAIARLYAFIADRGKWPYVADAAYFNDLPLRRPALLFAARAYTRPEYAELWKKLPPDTSVAELQRAFPIRQPLLWVTRSHA
jgi:Alginate lyase